MELTARYANVSKALNYWRGGKFFKFNVTFYLKSGIYNSHWYLLNLYLINNIFVFFSPDWICRRYPQVTFVEKLKLEIINFQRKFDGFSFIDQNMMDSHWLIRIRHATLHYKWRVTLKYDYSNIWAMFLWTNESFRDWVVQKNNERWMFIPSIRRFIIESWGV